MRKTRKIPSPSIDAIYTLKNKFPVKPDYVDAISYLFIALSVFGFIKLNPTIIWIGIVFQISIVLNARRNNLLSIPLFCLFSSFMILGFLYLQMARGFIPYR